MGKTTKRVVRLAQGVTAVITALKLAEKMMPSVAQRTRKELDALARSGFLSKKEAKQILKVAMAEAKREEKRMRKFIIAELKRETRKAKPAIKRTLARKKKQFERFKKLRRR
jgi:hypothetical protein